MIPGRGAALCALWALASLVSPAVHADPLLTRNQNPLLAPYGLPSPLPARLPAAGSGRVAAAVNWANAAVVKSSGPEDFTLDAEVLEVRLRLERAIGTQFAALVEVPWRSLSGGSLDGFIENWHDLWGLPDGHRRQLPRDQLLIEYRQNDDVLLHIDGSSSGIADLPIALGYQIGASDKGALAGWLTVKVPVGDANDLSGSGATDVALSLAGQTRLADRWQLFGQVDAVWLGQGDILPQLQESFAWSTLAGVSWNAWRGLDLTVQFAANSKVYDVNTTGLSGDAVVLSYGGTYRTASGWRFDLGMSEDIEVDASPDATFLVAVRHDF
jgi:hypothetical protein